MNIKNYIRKAKEMPVYELVGKLRVHLLRYIIYYVMSADLETMDDTKCLGITTRPMTMADTENLPDDYFPHGCHVMKKNALECHDKLYEGYMCYDENHVCAGYCWIMLRGSDYDIVRIQDTDAYVAEFYINKESRGQGLGPALITSVGRALAEKGLKEIKLTVRDYNKSAIRCYQKAGFVYRDKFVVFRYFGKLIPHHTI